MSILNLSQKQKQILVGVLTLLVVSGGGFGYYRYATSGGKNLPLDYQPIAKPVDPIVKDGLEATTNLATILADAKPEKLLFTELKLEDLQLYPKDWIEIHFTKEQADNELISGKYTDPDGDGVPNYLEFLYGSNPLNAYTLCGKKTDEAKCSLNDGENIKKNINPLTGLNIEKDKTFRIKQVDAQILGDIQNSFGTAIKEFGLDFPTAYQLSRTLDLSSEVVKIKVNTTATNRDGILKYLENRLAITKDTPEGELTAFSTAYKLLDTAKLAEIKSKYQGVESSLTNMVVPLTYSKFHSANIFAVQKMIQLFEYRIKVISTNKTEDQPTKDEGKKLTLELLWSYRNINEKEKEIIQAINDSQVKVFESSATN